MCGNAEKTLKTIGQEVGPGNMRIVNCTHLLVYATAARICESSEHCSHGISEFPHHEQTGSHPPALSLPLWNPTCASCPPLNTTQFLSFSLS